MGALPSQKYDFVLESFCKYLIENYSSVGYGSENTNASKIEEETTTNGWRLVPSPAAGLKLANRAKPKHKMNAPTTGMYLFPQKLKKRTLTKQLTNVNMLNTADKTIKTTAHVSIMYNLQLTIVSKIHTQMKILISGQSVV